MRDISECGISFSEIPRSMLTVPEQTGEHANFSHSIHISMMSLMKEAINISILPDKNIMLSST